MALTYYGNSHAIIDSPGNYTVDLDRTQPNTNHAALLVMPGTHNVTILLRSRLVSSGGAATLSCGIEANGCNSLTIIGQGGSVDGFRHGVRVENCSGLRIADLNVLSALFRGIKASGAGVAIERCRVGFVGGSTFDGPAARIMGIEAQGSNLRILRNTVGDVVAVGNEEAVPISIPDCTGDGRVAFNETRFAAIRDKQYAIWIGGPAENTAIVDVLYNIVENAKHGAMFSTPAAGILDHNTFRNCTVAHNAPQDDVLLGVCNSVL